MKIWTKIKLKNANKQIDIVANSLTNYVFKYGPISDIISKYKIDPKDVKVLNQYTTDRIAGLLLLYLAKDTKKINDIANKYNSFSQISVTPEIEEYMEK